MVWLEFQNQKTLVKAFWGLALLISLSAVLFLIQKNIPEYIHETMFFFYYFILVRIEIKYFLKIVYQSLIHNFLYYLLIFNETLSCLNF